MEFEKIEERKPILPTTLVGKTQIFRVVADEKSGECVEENEREAKSGGKFKQYKLFLQDEAGEQVVALYLFQRDLKELVNNVSLNSKDWINTFVSITASPREVGDQVYYDLVIKPAAMPTWAEEKVN